MGDLNIILRTCDKVEVFNGGPNRKRDFGTKNDVMKICAKSLKRSIDHLVLSAKSSVRLNLTIVDDNSSEEMLDFLTSVLEPTKLINLNDRGGNGNSFKECVDRAIISDGPVFLLEDDYLLSKECLHEMLSFYTENELIKKTKAFYHPVDYPDRYKSYYPSYIVTTEKRHWRTIRHTTCTFMGDASLFKEFYDILKRFELYGKDPSVNEDTTINLMYQKYLCFSPIRSLAEHLQFRETLSPYFRYEDYLIEKLSLQNY